MKKNTIPIDTAPMDGTIIKALFVQGMATRQWWLEPVYFVEGSWWWRGERLAISPKYWRSKQGGLGSNFWPKVDHNHRMMRDWRGHKTRDLAQWYPGLVLAEDPLAEEPEAASASGASVL